MFSFLLILLTICSFLFYGVIGPDKAWILSPVFVIGYALVAIALIKASWKLSVGRSTSSGEGLRLPVSSWFWFIFLVWGWLMVPRAVIPFDATFRVLFIGAVVGAYVVWSQKLKTFKDNRLVLGGLIFVVMLAALYGLVLHSKAPASVLWVERYVEYKGRLASTYICPNHFAHLIQLLLPFCIAMLFIPQVGIYLRILAGYSFLIFLPTVFLTESRAAWLGSIAACGVVICLMALRRSWKLFVALVIVVPLCSVLLLFSGWRYSETFQRRAEPVVEFLQGQAEDGVGSEARDFRPQTWMDTIDLIKESPLIGHGPGNYRYTYPEHRKRFRGQRIVTGHPHNEYLELTADYGLIGFGVFAVAWLVGLIWVLVKSLKTGELRYAYSGFAFVGAAAGTMVHSFFDFQMHVFPNAMVFALLAVIAVGPLSGAEKRKKKRGDVAEPVENKVSAQHTVMRAFVGWALSICFVVMTLVSIRTMASQYLNAMGDRMAEKQFEPDAAEKAEKYYQLAVKLDSKNWKAYRGLGRLMHLERRFCLDSVEKTILAEHEAAWFEQALVHNPKDAETLSALGRTLVFLSRNSREQSKELLNAGLGHLRTACQYRKFNDQYWWMLGIELRKSGRYEEALIAFRSMEKVRRTASSRKNIQWLEKRLTQSEEPRSSADAEAKKPSQAKMMLEEFDSGESRKSNSLDDLFLLMEP